MMTLRATTVERSPLDQIRQAEVDVTRQVTAARQVAEDVIREAQEQAADLKRQAREIGHREGLADYQATVSSAEDEARRLIAQACSQAENLRRSANVAKFLNDSGLICCASFVAPNRDSREHALSVIGKDNCLIIYLNPPLEVCIQRDPSGLYAAADSNESSDVPGLSFPYDEPEYSNLELDTSTLTVDQCLDQVLRLMREHEII